MKTMIIEGQISIFNIELTVDTITPPKRVVIEVKKVSKNEALDIIENRTPLGLFYTIDDGVYIGIDNRTGDVWTEEFKTLGTCKRWLMS